MSSLMCSATEDFDKHKINSELYKALMIGDGDRKVIELCRKVPDHAMHILTVHEDTVIHMATYFNRSDLVIRLLDELPEMYLDKMTSQNKAGNTILHETATNDSAVHVADKMLRKAPGLLGMRNNNGETALFRSARYGKADMFNFLAGKISVYDQAGKLPFLLRSDKTTVLHMSILALHFNLALQIAKEYKYLVDKTDIDGMTGLQLLACKPEAFNRRSEDGFIRKIINFIKHNCWTQEIEKEEDTYKSVLELAEFLIQRDVSWENTYSIQSSSRPKIHKYGVSNVSSTEKLQGGEVAPITTTGRGGIAAETSLFLATKSGCVEIVGQILEVYPQAIEYIDDEGRNILHVTIKYRQLEIFELLRHLKAPMERLVRKIDNNGNTILHMTGLKRADYVPEKIDGPAFELQDELHWYERVEKVTTPHLKYHQNNRMFTAKSLFAVTNSELRLSAKEWLKHTAEGCSLVAILIATVAFAAAYTVPGGTKQETGSPVLINQPLFVVFTITDVLSITFSLASVVTFLSILSSSFRLQDFKHSLPNQLIIGFSCLFLSVCMMMIAFAATILLMIKNKENWTKIVLYTVSFIPVGIFVLSFFPVYMRKPLHRALKLCGKTKHFIPRSLLAILKWISCYSSNSRASNSRAPTTGSTIP